MPHTGAAQPRAASADVALMAELAHSRKAMSQQQTPDHVPRPARQHQEPRESIWSVRRKHADTFFATLFTLWIVVATATTAIHLDTHPIPANTQTAEWIARAALNILLKLGPSTIAVVMIAMILNRPLTITGDVIVITYAAAKERFVYGPRRRSEEALAEAKAQAKAQTKKALAEAKAQGMAQGMAQANEKWEAWLERKEAAETNGKPFDEPPPSRSQAA